MASSPLFPLQVLFEMMGIVLPVLGNHYNADMDNVNT
jgi:hypothetical protein